MSREHGTGIGTDGDLFGLAEAHWEVHAVEHRLHPDKEPARPSHVGYALAPQDSGPASDEPLAAGFRTSTASAGGGGPGAPGGEGGAGEPAVLSSEQYKQRYYDHVHRLPTNPGAMDYVLFIPLALGKFMQRLCDAFGFKFTWLVAAVYGISQGLGETYMGLSTDYYLKENMGLDPAQAQAFKSVIHLPWNIKPLYGLVSDMFPIVGYHRTPYLFIAGLVGTLAWVVVASLGKASFGVAAFLILLANYSIASPDVIIDAAITERTQQAPIYASDLQSLCWGAHAVGGIMGCTTVGQAQAHLHARGVFALNAPTAFLILVLAALRWLPEKQVPVDQRPNGCAACRRGLHSGQRSLYLLAIFVAGCAVLLATTVTHVPNKLVAGYITMSVAIVVASTVYWVLARISPKIAKPAVYFFLREAVVPNIGEAMFQWYTSAKPNPHFSPQFLSLLDCVAMATSIIGISLYNRYMSGWKYRNIFIGTQILSVGAGLLDYVLVKRWNLKVGLSDKAFVLGDEALVPLIRKFSAIPFFVLAAKVCPEKCEATLFALLMALSNFGGDVGSYVGVVMLHWFDVTRKDWSHLPTVVLIKSLARFIPVLLIPFLIPDASPADEILSEKEKHLDLDTSGSEAAGGGEGGESGRASEAEEEGIELGGLARDHSVHSAGLPATQPSSSYSSPARRRPSVAGRSGSGGGGSGSGDLDGLGGAAIDRGVEDIR